MTNSSDTHYKNYNVQTQHCTNETDADGNPTGGGVSGIGLSIQWQDGPRANADGSLADSNGAFVEDAIYAALQRLQFFQASDYKTRQNAIAITKLEEALWALNDRRLERQSRGVEGKHSV